MSETEHAIVGVHKTWAYTWNNYTEKDIEQLKLLKVSMHRCCKEIATTGTPHLQGYITFKRAYRFSQLKKLFPKIRWDSGKTIDGENYCIKGDVVIDIQESHQGDRSDLKKIGEMVKEGKSVRDIAGSYPSQYMRYHKGIQALQIALAPETTEYKKLDVIVVYGPPGCGKTRMAYAYDPKIYSVPEPVNGSIWFDGYIGQKTILFDDFYGWIKYHTLLQYLDGYPMSIPIKGGMVKKNWTTVYITSNKKPTEWYNREEIDALSRRITEVIETQ